MPHINSAGLAILVRFEGCELYAYKDVAGVLTIGYGHTGPDVHPGDTITPERAKELLQADCETSENGVQALVEVLLNPNQFSALVSFVYNVGVTAFHESTLLQRINAKDFAGAAAQFDRWVYAGGKAQPGLISRRAAERALFEEPWSPEPAKPGTQAKPH